MSRIEEEKQTVEVMIRLYCRQVHGQPELCVECRELLDYAIVRLDKCRFGEHKPTCDSCPIHCYKPDMRERMRAAMRYSGPRMMWHHPIMAIKHLIRKIR